MVRVSGPSARVVPVTPGYAGRAWELARRAGSDFVFRPGPAGRSYKNFVTNFARGLAADPAAPAAVAAPGPVHLHLRSPGRGHPGPGAAGGHRDRRGRVAGPLRPPRAGHQLLHGRPAGPLPGGACPVSGAGLMLPPPGGGISGQAVAFAAKLVDRSGTAPVIEAALAHRTGRPRPLPVRAVLTALVCLALDDRPLFLTDATRLLFCQLSGDLPPAARRPRHRQRRAGVPERLPPGPLLLRRHLLGDGPLAAAEKPAADRAGPQRPHQADDPSPDQAARGRLEAVINALTEASISRPGRRRTRSLRRLHRAGRHPGPAVLPRPVQAHRAVRQRPRRRLVRPRRRPPRARRRQGKAAAEDLPGRWRPPSPPWPGRPARRPRSRTSPSAWRWPGPAKTPAAPAPGSWPPSPPAGKARLARLRPRLHRCAARAIPAARPRPGLPAGDGLPDRPARHPGQYRRRHPRRGNLVLPRPARAADHRHHPPARPRHHPRPLRPADHRPGLLPAQTQRRPRHRRLPAAVLPGHRPPPPADLPARKTS